VRSDSTNICRLCNVCVVEVVSCLRHVFVSAFLGYTGMFLHFCYLEFCYLAM
jgi:hypothetical protein